MPSLEQYRLLRELFATAGNVTKALLMSAFLKIYLQDSQVCIWDAIHMVVCRGFHARLSMIAFTQHRLQDCESRPAFAVISIVCTVFLGLRPWHAHR